MTSTEQGVTYSDNVSTPGTLLGVSMSWGTFLLLDKVADAQGRGQENSSPGTSAEDEKTELAQLGSLTLHKPLLTEKRGSALKAFYDSSL